MRAGEMGGRASSLSDYSTRVDQDCAIVRESCGPAAGGCVSRRSQAPRHRFHRRRASSLHHLDARDSLSPRDSKWTHFGIPSEATTSTTMLNVLLPNPCFSLAPFSSFTLAQIVTTSMTELSSMDVKGLLRLDVHSMAKVLRLPAVSSRLSPGAARPSTVPQTSLAGSVILPLEPEDPPTMLHWSHCVI